MAKYRYKYNGEEEVYIPYVGTFKPGEEKTVEAKIDNPLFEEVKKTAKRKEK